MAGEIRAVYPLEYIVRVDPEFHQRLSQGESFQRTMHVVDRKDATPTEN